MEKLIKKLSEYGNIEVIKDDYVFTLLLTKKTNGYILTKNQIPFKVMELVLDFLGNSKTNIEVMKNEEDFLLLIIKP